jgi:hypothetical protein
LRKIAAIFLLILLSFNWYGYRIAISLLNKNADTRLEARIDESAYDESQLVEIRVPLNMPYQDRFTDFERHYGEIELNGKSYTYVKRKIEGNVAIFKCIANESKQELKTIDQDLTKANSNAGIDQPGKQPSKQLPVFKNILSDYDDQTQFNSLKAAIAEINPYFLTYSFFIPEVISNTPHQPPKTV